MQVGGGRLMKTEKRGGPTKTATSTQSIREKLTSFNTMVHSCENRKKSENAELQLLSLDFRRIFNGYKQLGIAHAELLLDQPFVLRDYLMEDLYPSTLHPDVCVDMKSFLEAVDQYRRLRGATS